MKREIELWDNAGRILEATGKGVLLTTKAGEKVNAMVIGWGTLGIEWGKPIFTAFVRQSRFTKELLDKNPEFTVNIPVGELPKQVLGICGSKSGRDLDKIAELGLTLEEPLTVSVPAIRQLPLTLECKVIYRQDQVLSEIDTQSRDRFYAKGTANETDYHTAFYGQVVASYIIE